MSGGTVRAGSVVAILSAAFLMLCPADAAAATLYARPAATGTGSCGSWANACTLQTALGAAGAPDEIWVMAGTHSPGPNQTDTFQLVDGVAVYGGFDGGETSRSQRDPAINLTILSGGNVNYHVVTWSGSGTTVLDGFTVTGGNAVSGSWPGNTGAGMFSEDGSPTLHDVIFSGNSGTWAAGMWVDHGSPTLTDVTFSGNAVSQGAGGIYTYSAAPTLSNVTFSGNSAGNLGGGMFIDQGSATLRNVTFSGNSANHGGGIYIWPGSATLNNVTFFGNSATSATHTTGNGGGIYYYGGAADLLQLTNVILWGDTADVDGAEIFNHVSSVGTLTITDSVVQGGCPGGPNCTCTNLITADPVLGPLASNGGLTQTHALLPGSSAIDAGGVNSTCEPTDQRGVTRPQGDACDIGAYEYEAEPAPVADPIPTVAPAGLALFAALLALAGTALVRRRML